MTLLIAYLLLAEFDYGFWSYFWTFVLWIWHVGYHHVDLSDLKKMVARMSVGGRT